jgi:hypothetical protein
MGRRTSDLPDILRLNLPGLSRVDPNDKDALCLLWNIFSKCGTTIENGRRLENISWRLWNREVLAEDWDQPRKLTLHQLGQLLDLVSSAAHPPAHAAGVRSSPRTASDAKQSPRQTARGDHHQEEGPRQQQQHQQQRQEASSRNQQQQQSSVEETKPVRSRAPSLFQKTKKPSPADKLYDDDDDDGLSSDFPSDTEDEYEDYEDDDEEQDKRLSYKHRSGTSTSIVRGFDPAQVSVVNRSPNSVANNNNSSNDDSSSKTKPQAAQSKLAKAPVPREKMFFIESSPSDSEDQPHAADSYSTNDDSSGPRMFRKQQPIQHKASSLSKSISSNRGHYEEAVEDDEDSDWDSVDDESDSSFDEKTVFVRDDEKQKKPLTKPSLLSSLFLNNPELVQQQQQKQRQKEKGASRPPAAPPKKQPSSNLHSALNPTENLLNATAQTHAPPPAIALSPRTTRRNMLASELSESLRKNLLWERQQSNAYRISDPTTEEEPPSDDPTNSGGGGGGLKKSHTSADISTFRSAQGSRLPRNKSAAVLNDNVTGTWREDMDDTNIDFNYHARGW